MRLHEPLFHWLALRLSRDWISPDKVTLASVPPALLAGVCVSQGWFLLCALFFALSGVADLLDGALARATGRSTRFGALLDSSLDRIADGCIPLGLIVFYAPHGAVAVIPGAAMLAGMWIPYVRARAQSLGLALPRLWMRREDRFVALLLALVAAPWLGVGAPVPGLPVLVVLGAIAVLGLVAGVSALAAAARADRRTGGPGQ